MNKEDKTEEIEEILDGARKWFRHTDSEFGVSSDDELGRYTSKRLRRSDYKANAYSIVEAAVEDFSDFVAHSGEFPPREEEELIDHVASSLCDFSHEVVGEEEIRKDLRMGIENRRSKNTHGEHGNGNFADLEEAQIRLGEWSRQQFGDQGSINPFLGMIEEMGEMTRIILKRRQDIRQEELADEDLGRELADVMIYALDFAEREGFTLADPFEEKLEEVLERDFRS